MRAPTAEAAPVSRLVDSPSLSLPAQTAFCRAMRHLTSLVPSWLRVGLLAAALLPVALTAQFSVAGAPDEEAAVALKLAQRFIAGGDDARAALHEALGKMGWDVRDMDGKILRAALAGTATGLAMRDYEIEELLWNTDEQLGLRMIVYAEGLSIPFEGANPSALAKDLMKALQASAKSERPQQRFWAYFIDALGRTNQTPYSLLDEGFLLKPSQRDNLRLKQIDGQLKVLQQQFASADPVKRKMLEAKAKPLFRERGQLAVKGQKAMAQQLQALSTGKPAPEEPASDWQENRLSLLQVALITRVLNADMYLAAAAAGQSERKTLAHWLLRPMNSLPLAAMSVAQTGDSQSFGDILGVAAGDMWAAGWGAYTSAVLDQHMPDSKAGGILSKAN